MNSQQEATMVFGGQKPSQSRIAAVTRGADRGSNRPGYDDEADDINAESLLISFVALLAAVFGAIVLYSYLSDAPKEDTTQARTERQTTLVAPARTSRASPLYADADPALLGVCFEPAIYNPAHRGFVDPRHEATIAQYAGFLGCLMSRFPQRYCDDGNKEQLVAQIRTYLAMRREATVYFDSRLALGVTAPVIEEWLEPGAGVAKMQASRVDRPSSRIDPQFGEALAGLARNGYISAYDFSFLAMSTPYDLRPFLHISQEREPNCR